MKIIGAETVYYGVTHRFMYGDRVVIKRVMRDAEDSLMVFTTDKEIEEAGGINLETDCVEVRPFIREESRFSWVSSNADIRDLELFGAKPKIEVLKMKGQ